eukprot:TRINITY_DN20839_c0_g1_i1.p1 TRINITY_DN20839_c0_g1~~TRINITY_DN20839_c0_g1_i1.p1  ORF type:complete len:854 (-),score=285.55 TRINITY_DN20839_c0_g1_i1:152-2713(-)
MAAVAALPELPNDPEALREALASLENKLQGLLEEDRKLRKQKFQAKKNRSAAAPEDDAARERRRSAADEAEKAAAEKAAADKAAEQARRVQEAEAARDALEAKAAAAEAELLAEVKRAREARHSEALRAVLAAAEEAKLEEIAREARTSLDAVAAAAEKAAAAEEAAAAAPAVAPLAGPEREEEDEEILAELASLKAEVAALEAAEASEVAAAVLAQEMAVTPGAASSTATAAVASSAGGRPSAGKEEAAGKEEEAAVDAPVGAPAAASGGKGKGKGPPPPPKGKGKGPGKGPPPPPPPANSGGPRASLTGKPPATSKCVSLHWKVTSQPEEVSGHGDDYLAKLRNLGAMFPERLADPDAVRFDIPQRPDNVFAPLEDPCEPPPRALLEAYFEKFNLLNNWQPQTQDTPKVAASEATPQALLDLTRLRMLGITMRIFLMSHGTSCKNGSVVVEAEDGQSKEEKQCSHCAAVRPLASRIRTIMPTIGIREIQAILAIKCGVLRCDWNVTNLEMLTILQAALCQHEKDGRPVNEFVQVNGESAIATLDHPELHCLVFELTKIPQVEIRLVCMIFVLTYKETLQMAKRNLEVLLEALAMLQRKREISRRFFQTAHRLGQSFPSSGNRLSRGFQLRTLEEMSRTKSTKFPELTMMHFVLALMEPSDADALFDERDQALLQRASALKTDKVIQDALELTKIFYSVQALFGETGKYTCPVTGQGISIERRRRSVVMRPPSERLQEQQPSTASVLEGDLDENDKFHEVLETFVQENLDSAEDVAERAWEAGLTYKELAIYFDDLKSVHPPPKSTKNGPGGTEDLLDIFFKFSSDVLTHRSDVESKNVRRLIASIEHGAVI